MNDLKTSECIEMHGVRVVRLFPQGPLLSRGSDAIEWVSVLSSCEAQMLVIPRERLPEAFFELRTGLAGELMQKFTTYGARVAVLGDCSQEIAESRSFASLVLESNRGDRFWFIRDDGALAARLKAAAPVHDG